MRKNLVLSVSGDTSVHNTWLTGNTPRSFDLCLVYYGDITNRFAADADIYFAQKGIKFALIHSLAACELASVLFRYAHVWVPDDDIAASTDEVNRLFKLADEHNLAICQPAIGRGEVTYRALRPRAAFLLRYSRFVEIACRLFSREALLKTLPTFNANCSGWGLDWLWPSLFRPKDFAVVDAVPVSHTRAIRTGDLYRNLAAQGIDPMCEHRELLAAHGINDR